MRKKILSVLLATAMVATMVGCGKTDDKGSVADSKDVAKTSEAGSTTAGGEVESITLTVWSPSEDQSQDNGNWLGTMCDKFAEEHPEWDITFEYGVCAESDAKATVTQDVDGAADVYMYANDNLTDLVASNGIAKLGGETADYVKDTNSAAIVDSVSLNGDIYGVPFTTNTWFMYYDTSVFTEEDAANLDTMLEKGKVAFPLGDSWYIASFYVANGCTLFGNANDETKDIDFGGDKAVAVTNYLVDLIDNPNFVFDNAGSAIALSGLRDGSVNAMFSGSWNYTTVKEALGDNFGAKQLPTVTIDGADKQLMAFAGSKAIGVNPTSKNMAAAVALAKYLGGVEAQRAHYEMRSIVPCNTELLEEEAIQQDALVSAQNDTFDNTSIIQPFVSAMGNYWSPAENFGKALFNKEVTHANAAEVTEELNKALNTSIVE